MVGQTISNFKILSKLGSGGMGAVYKAKDLKLERFVAIKVLHDSIIKNHGEALERFWIEARAAAKLDHPNIGVLHQTDESDGQIYMVMTLYEGQDLKNKLKEGSLPLEKALDYSKQIARALHYTHQAGIIHRDIKPANIFITKQEQIKILDFGLAKLQDYKTTVPQSQTVSFMGTLGYMSPEQLQNKDVDKPALDIWAWGLVLFEMLTGKNPFGEGMVVINNTLYEPPETLEGYLSEGAEKLSLQKIIDLALEKPLEKRYSSFKDVLLDLEKVNQHDKVSELPTNNLPKRIKDLVGREPELARINTDLSDPECFLLTILGQGGIGKTQLALNVAKKQLEENNFPDGVYFVALDSLTSAEYIPSTIMHTLGKNLSGHQDPWEDVMRYLADAQILLILDNLEHIIDEAIKGIGKLVQQLTRLTIMVTSREALNLEDEWLVQLSGLEIPTSESDDLESFAATNLFLRIAERTKGSFEPTPEEKISIVNICKVLEGWPLGIELAAVLIRQMSYSKVANQIHKNVDLLTKSSKRMPSRHLSVRAVFEYSWQLLSEEQKRILSEISIFRGGFGLEAVKEIVNATDTHLDELVYKSLLRFVNIGLENGRYDCHMLVYQLANEKLATNKTKHLKNSHAKYYKNYAKEVSVKLKGKPLKEDIKHLEIEMDNLRAALQWSLEEKQLSLGLSLAIILAHFWSTQGYWVEGRKWFESFLALSEENEVENKPAAFYLTGRFATRLGDLEAAHKYFTESLNAYRILENEKMVAKVLSRLGEVVSLRGNFELAFSFLEESINISSGLQDKDTRGQALLFLGHNHLRQDAYREATEVYASYLHLAEKSNDVYTLALAKICLGNVARLKTDYQRAEGYLKEALDMLEGFDEHNIATANHYLGVVTLALDKSQEAKEHLKKSLLTFRKLDSNDTYDLLEEFALVAIYEEKTIPATTIISAARKLRPENAMVEVSELKRFERGLQTLKSKLPQQELESAWEEGKSFNLSQIIDYTLAFFDL